MADVVETAYQIKSDYGTKEQILAKWELFLNSGYQNAAWYLLPVCTFVQSTWVFGLVLNDLIWIMKLDWWQTLYFPYLNTVEGYWNIRICLV